MLVPKFVVKEFQYMQNKFFQSNLLPTYTKSLLQSVGCNCDPDGSLHDYCNDNGECDCKVNVEGKCSPWYGRYLTFSGIPFVTMYLPTWEDCGRVCQEEGGQCKSWSWNVPDNDCHGTNGHCKLCKMFGEEANIDTNTAQNENWISGNDSCYSSDGSDATDCTG